MEASKRDACLTAIEELYKLGALSDCLLPKEDDAEPEEQVSGSTDEDECEGQTSASFLLANTFIVSVGFQKFTI